MSYRAKRFQSESPTESITNYVEQLVFDEIAKQLPSRAGVDFNDSDLIADIACVSLNNIPPRYVRNHVDLMFYMPDQERRALEGHVVTVVTLAIDFVLKRT